MPIPTIAAARLTGYSLAVFLHRDWSNWVNGGVRLMHGFATRVEPVSTVRQSVEDGIGERDLANAARQGERNECLLNDYLIGI